MSGTGWAYMLVLTFLTGVAAHGLLVFAQQTIQIGTIGIAQVVQPALAVVWSFLLLGERCAHCRSWASPSSMAVAGLPGVEPAREPTPRTTGTGSQLAPVP